MSYLYETALDRVKFYHYVEDNYVYLVVWRAAFTTGCIVRPIAYEGATLELLYEGGSAPSDTLYSATYTNVAME